MSQFSTTRIADKTTAVGGNAQLQPAINWLHTNTPMCRLTQLEVYEVLQAMAAASSVWTTMPKFNTVTVP
jgi:hypothetical protein